MIVPILILILISFLPIFELRLAIPVGIILMGLNPFLVFGISVVANLVIGLIVYLFLDLIVKLICKVSLFNKWYNSYLVKAQKKIEIPVRRFGWFGLAIFIGIPLPGSGVYTGAVIAKVIGINFREFIVACIIGVIVSGIIMFSLSLFFNEVLAFVGYSKIESVRRLFGL